jgi:YHS domain-containing protein/thioredoxin-related protein
MRNIRRLFWAAAGVLLLPAVAAAQQPIRWQPTLESAKRLAVQTNRLVLIHFWADWCQRCQEMDRDVFSQSSVAAAVESNYVPVKVNADYFPTTCKQYGVTALPTDIIITPEGHRIDNVRGRLPASEYVARLNRAAAAGRRTAAERYAQIAGGQPPAAEHSAGAVPAGVDPQWNTAGYRAPATPPPADPRYGESYGRQRQAAPAMGYSSDPRRPIVDARGEPSLPPPQAATAAWQAPPRDQVAASTDSGPALHAPTGQSPQTNPPLGLDGYCPVQLSDDMKANVYRWTMGDRRWGAIHRGRTYLFAGPEQQQRFLADPDRYAPVLSGNDVVMAVEQGQAVSGRREHGVLFRDNVYLFAGEASLETFSKNPEHYARQILQAMQAETYRR